MRNDRGSELLALLGDEVALSAPDSKGDRSAMVKGFMANTILAAGGLPLRRMPNWLRPIVGRIMPLVGPTGLEFGRARVEMKAIETVLFLRRVRPAMMKNMIPPHVWRLAQRYGLTPEAEEKR